MKDNFSEQAADYARYRPQYPRELFEYIIGLVSEKKFAWDCGTGNGQTAMELSRHFEKVYATDISSKQIEYAVKEKNITYIVEPAESTGIENNTTDLITVSQALHWFDFDKFYDEVKRVSKPGGLIAVWTYSLLQVDTITDALIHKHHFDTLEKYWDEERKYVDDGYSSIPFPFEKINTPEFFIEVNWNTGDLEGYFNTWSALQKFTRHNNYNPVPALMKEIKLHWRDGHTRKIIFPIHLKMAVVWPL
ncbi:MAG: class I SAM-dependent methyltransferase [Ferruginibacter sp.]